MNILLFIITLALFPLTYALDYGIDRLKESEVQNQLLGKNLAVLTHAAGRNKADEHLIDLLHKNFSLKKIFAPEHGLRSTEDDWVQDGIDPSTGLAVISLYKRTTKAPKKEELLGIDAIVVDLQDVGVRYYTYFSTIAEVMKVAGAMGVEVIILDRPNLLGGNILEGHTLSDLNAGNFAAYYTIPTRHGMTLGELSLLYRSEKILSVKLTIIKAQGWGRESLIQELERSWIPPSPALTEIQQVATYALWGALENANLSVGRGVTNEKAFRVIGAPWITREESVTLAHKLNQLKFPGVQFTPHSWRVTRAIFNGETAHGVELHLDSLNLRSDEFIYKVSSTLHAFFKSRLSLDRMAVIGLGSTEMLSAIKAGIPWRDYVKKIDQEISEFKKRRENYLLY